MGREEYFNTILPLPNYIRRSYSPSELIYYFNQEWLYVDIFFYLFEFLTCKYYNNLIIISFTYDEIFENLLKIELLHLLEQAFTTE